jgi:hypothetical protein
MKNRFATILVTALIISCVLIKLHYHLQKGGHFPELNVLNSDLYAHFLPFFTFMKVGIAERSFPLWNPYMSVGSPFLGIIPCGLFYPVNWFIFLLEVPHAILAIQFTDVVIGMLGMILYMRYLRLKWPAVFLGAILFGYAVFSDTFMLHIGSTYCWLPVILWSIHRLFDQPDFRNTALLAVSFAFSFLAGHTQYFYYIGLIAFFYSFLLVMCSRYEYKLRAVFLRLVLIGVAVVIMLGLIAVQLFPTVELSLHSARDVTRNIASRDMNAGLFSAILMLKNYLNRDGAYLCNTGFNYVPYAAYYHGAVLLLVPFSIVFYRKNKPVTVALFGSLGYTILFVLSKQVPALSIFGKLPLADVFRWPWRMFELSQFMVAALAGIGLSSLVETERAAGSRGCNISPQMKKIGAWLILALVLTDMLSRRYINYPVPSTTATATDRLLRDTRVEWVQKHAGYDRALIMMEKIRFNPNAGSMFQFFDINSYTPFALIRPGNFFSLNTNVGRSARLFFGSFGFSSDLSHLQKAKLSGLASLRYFVSYLELDQLRALLGNTHPFDKKKILDDWKLCCEENDETGPFFVYENRHALPRAYLVNHYVQTQNEQESLQAVKKNISDLSTSVVLEGGEPSFPAADVPARPGTARIEQYGLNKVALYVETGESSLLVLTDLFFSGWNAYLDGTKRPIWRANSIFRAVEIPPGTHRVVFEYRPLSLYHGLIVSICCLTLVLAGLIFEKNRRKNLQRPPESSTADAKMQALNAAGTGSFMRSRD